MNYKFYFRDYKMFPYEKKLGEQEVQVLFSEKITNCIDYLEINSNEVISEDDLLRLTYFKLIRKDDTDIVPTLYLLEQSASDHNRQSTRYSAHGIHEYRGKFNPQVVHVLLNIFGAKKNSLVYDPFCGSGTTLLESSLMGIESIGTDVNPLAIFIANAKQNALKIDSNDIQTSWNLIKRNTTECMGEYKVDNVATERFIYLSKWFPKETLALIEHLKKEVENIDPNIRDIILVLISNNLRDYSNQEPMDLRIRKRNSPFPKLSLLDKISDDVSNFCNKLNKSSKVNTPEPNEGRAFLCDNSISISENIAKESIDFAITSPPYATALPYIDTQRLSLVWLDFVESKDIINMERKLIGTRELKKSEINNLIDQLRENESELPPYLIDYINMLQDTLSESDGFRRQAVPALMYHYFSSMQKMFINVRESMKKNGEYALIVGTNSTTLGGQKFIVDTPEWLAHIAESNGWSVSEMLKLETYKRYGIHAKNSVNQETLIILKKK